MIDIQVLKFIGKLTREKRWLSLQQLLSCWCNNKFPQGGVQLTSNKMIIKFLHHLYPSYYNILNYTIYIKTDNNSSFKYWFKTHVIREVMIDYSSLDCSTPTVSYMSPH